MPNDGGEMKMHRFTALSLFVLALAQLAQAFVANNAAHDRAKLDAALLEMIHSYTASRLQ